MKETMKNKERKRRVCLLFFSWRWRDVEKSRLTDTFYFGFATCVVVDRAAARASRIGPKCSHGRYVKRFGSRSMLLRFPNFV